MNNKGFAATGMLYIVLLLFIAMYTSLLIMFANRRKIYDNIKDEIVNGVKATTKVEIIDLTELGFTKNDDGTYTKAYSYTGSQEEIKVPLNGSYKIELWGAQGGYGIWGSSYFRYGGFGAYSVGTIKLNLNKTLYLNVGGKGAQYTGGYNGGGNGTYSRAVEYSGGGGGATHIAISSGLLSSLSSKISDILMVAGGGGSGSTCSTTSEITIYNAGGAGGGISGGSNYANSNTGGTQTTGGTVLSNYSGQSGVFGQGASGIISPGSYCESQGGGGGGFYGGSATNYGGSGGSGYIGNELLSDKKMYCYNCTESSDESTKTISTTCNASEPTSNCTKIGNGYAKITYLGS